MSNSQKIADLFQCKQKEGQRLTEWLTDFEFRLDEAGGASWSPDLRLGFLSNGLCGFLSKNAKSSTMPEDYDEYVKSLLSMAEAYEQGPEFAVKRRKYIVMKAKMSPPMKIQADRQPGRPPARPQLVGDSGTEFLDSAFSYLQAKYCPAPKTPPPPNGRAAWANKYELQSRCIEGRCLRCGAGTHLKENCPYVAPRLEYIRVPGKNGGERVQKVLTWPSSKKKAVDPK